MLPASSASAALRAAGLTVVEHDRWETRGKPGTWSPEGTFVHHTAGPGPQHGPAPSLAYCYDNLLCQVLLARDGVWHLLAWGLTWHAGEGVPAALARFQAALPPLGDAIDVYGPGATPDDFGGMNQRTVGIECENTGQGEPWPAVQVDSLNRGIAALHDAGGWPATRVWGHREWTERKIDPNGLDLAAVRAAVHDLLTNGDDVPLNAQDLDAIRGIVRQEINDAADEQTGTLKTLIDRRFKTLIRRYFKRDHLTDEIDR